MTEKETAAVRAANAAIEAATDHIKEQREKNRMAKMRIYCLTAFACILTVCATVVACFAIYAQQQTIIEQQYALNMQYASIVEYVSGAEITTETSEYSAQSDGDGSIAVAGDGNITAGGDVNGK